MIRPLLYLTGGAPLAWNRRLLRASAGRPTMTALAMRLATVRQTGPGTGTAGRSR